MVKMVKGVKGLKEEKVNRLMVCCDDWWMG